MKYQFILSYKATDSDEVLTNTCHPVYGDDLSVTIDREDGEWYYKRKLDGKITFERDDYRWIMARPFDGTFTLAVNETHDGGASWHPYFEGTFSRANLEIDEDNQAASLSSFIEGVYNAIENGKDEDYDLMKIIPDGDAKEVQGQVHPALAMVDYNTTNIEHSDVFCKSAITSDGYDSKHPDSGYNEGERVVSNDDWNFIGIFAEAKRKTDNNADANGYYAGQLYYHTGPTPSIDYYLYGRLDGPNGYYMIMGWDYYEVQGHDIIRRSLTLYDSNNSEIEEVWCGGQSELHDRVSPASMIFGYITVYAHYIRATLLTQDGGNSGNVLDTGAYYKRMAAFNNQDGGLSIAITTNTSETPNGHRLIPGTGEQGTTPQYFAPPDDTNNWIPLAEFGWQFASMWYTITPSVANGLLDETKIGSFRWTRCWTLGTVLRYLLDRITDGKVVFTEDTTSSQFLYSTVNPVNQHEPFDYLITQKSNVMRPSNGGESAARCTVRLQWFLELLRNAFNCYYWLEKRNDGKYLFRVEHVEYCRKGGRYDGDLDHSINITTLKPRRNFRNQLNQLAKTYADQTNKYAYNMQNMVEKYTFSWQGDGGSDAFKGNPMFFKAGWIEKSSSEDHQVDNIFADLAWLMLNSGTDTASSKNYDGVFLFAGYMRYNEWSWTENARPSMRYPSLSSGSHIVFFGDIWFTTPQGNEINVWLRNTDTMHDTLVQSVTSTGSQQVLSLMVEELHIGGGWSLFIDFGSDWNQVVIHRVHYNDGSVNLYNVPNTTDLLNTENYLQNGPLAWPWLQNEHLHYDIPANKWCYKHDNLQDIATEDWKDNGTVKMIQKQEVKVFPMPEKSTENSIMDITGIHTSIEGGKTGIITNAKINLSSRNAELTIVYDPVPPQQ